MVPSWPPLLAAMAAASGRRALRAMAAAMDVVPSAQWMWSPSPLGCGPLWPVWDGLGRLASLQFAGLMPEYKLSLRLPLSLHWMCSFRSSDCSVPTADDVGRLCREGRLKEAVDVLHDLERDGIRLHSEIIAQLLQECAQKKNVADGKRLHGYILRSRLGSSPFLVGHLIRMYATCGRMVDARQVFDNMPRQKVFAWTALMKGYISHGQSMESLELFKQMQSVGVRPDKFVFVVVVNACARLGDLEQGKRIHAHITSSGCATDIFVENALIDMYAKCNSIGDARQVFDTMQRRDVVSWNAMISGYSRTGLGEECVKLFEQMQIDEVKPNTVTFACVLQGCAAKKLLQVGMQVHARALTSAMATDVLVGTALVDMYAKCGKLGDAFKAFCSMPRQDVPTWNALLRGCVEHGQGMEAVKLFHQMLLYPRLQLDSFTFNSVLKACASIPSLDEGKYCHALIAEKGMHTDLNVASALMDMYTRFGKIKEAEDVFHQLPRQNVESWNGLLKVLASSGYNERVLELFHQMQKDGVEPDETSFVLVVNACSHLGALENGVCLRSQIEQCRFESHMFVGTALVDMYSKCGKIDAARQLFDKLSRRDVVSWNVILKGYAQQGLGQDALQLFRRMQQEEVEPDTFTFVAILNACASLGDLDEGRRIHNLTAEKGHTADIFLGNALIDMYTECGSTKDAALVFKKMSTKDLVSWNSLIKGYSQLGQGMEALELFQRMQQEGLQPDTVTYISVLKACASTRAHEEGRKIHGQLKEIGQDTDTSVGNCLLDMYVKCGELPAAHQVFDSLIEKDEVSWSTLIVGYSHHGCPKECLQLFKRMQEEGVKPSSISVVSALNACANGVSLDEGKQIHALVTKSDFQYNVCVGNALIDMYAKCGNPEQAWQVFETMSERDVVSWNTMIAGYGQNGLGRDALELFEQMQKQNIKLDHITFISVLSACNHIGLTDEGCNYFDSMTGEFGVVPTVEHYACLVHLLGRAGRLYEAEEVVKGMMLPPSPAVWIALLDASRVHGDIKLAERTAAHVIELEPENASAYLLLANTYAALGHRDEEAIVRNLMLRRGVKKTPGCSWVELNDQIHQFVVADRSHATTKDIYAKAEKLCEKMQAAGHKGRPLDHDLVASPKTGSR